MKKNSLFILLAVGIAFAACKKETKTVTVYQEPAPAMEGSWEGYYGGVKYAAADTSFYYPTSGYSMVLKSGGKATVYNSLLADTMPNVRAEGTWVYSSNNTVVVDYTYVTGASHYIIRASVDSKMKAINGRWYNSNNVVGGAFFMVKK